MPKTALTCDDTGRLVVPTGSVEWDGWVSASRTRNHVLGDPLVDWLDCYGEMKGYERDRPDPRTDYLGFVFRKGRDFETRVISYLTRLRPGGVRTIVSADASLSRVVSLDAAEATWEAMAEGTPIIYQGVLWDARHRVYGAPDLLVRSDTLLSLFHQSLHPAQVTIPATDLDIGDRHYVIVDIKYSTLRFNAGGNGLRNSGSTRAYKAQVLLYNRALGHLQGYHPVQAFLLGRGWSRTQKGVTERSSSCMDRLGPVRMDESWDNTCLEVHADQAVEWIRRMRRHGHDWQAVPATVEELRPNAKDNQGQWTSAVKQIAAETKDLTQLWGVGVRKRREANRAGLFRWTDPRVTPESLGIRGNNAVTLGALLDVNRQPDTPPVLSPQTGTARSEWIETPPLEFYVDFETVSNLDDDFARFPLNNGQPLIYMIGCGHLELGEWRFECFIADQLTEPDEADIIEKWLAHMNTVRDRIAPDSNPKVIHWSAAEASSLERAYNSARNRHPSRQDRWANPNWFDFLTRVIRTEPVAVRGSFGFGLKPFTNALHQHGLVNCQWSTGPTDGLGAMVGAWWCQSQINQERAERLIDLELMKQIRAYNEVDCRAMMESVAYLRSIGADQQLATAKTFR